MATVKRYIEKFDREVTIDEDHPLCRLQDELDAKAAEGEKSEKGKKGGKGKKGAEDPSE